MEQRAIWEDVSYALRLPILVRVPRFAWGVAYQFACDVELFGKFGFEVVECFIGADFDCGAAGG